MIKMVVTDLDGTLLNKHKQLSTYTIQTLLQAQQQGIRLVLATGRNYQSLKPIYTQLKMHEFKSGAIIGVNGEELYFFDDEKYQKKAYLKANDVNYLCPKLKRLGFLVMIMSDDRNIELSSSLLRYLKTIVYKIKHRDLNISFEGMMKNHSFVKNTRQNKDVNKLGLAQSELYINLMMPIVKKICKNFEVLKVSKCWVEIMPRGVSKGSGLQCLLDRYGISKEEVIVFGDGENDLSLFEVTPNSYAPKNALKSVKTKANNICLHHNEDGVAKIVSQYLK